MAPDVGLSAVRRPMPWAWLLVAILLAGVAWLGVPLPRPWGGDVREALRGLREPALMLAALLVGGWIAWSAVRARNREPLPAEADVEMALFSPPDLMACRSPVPVVALAGLERGAGASTLTFNLAMCLAVHGEVPGPKVGRAPRPVCLLAEGPLTAALGLHAGELEDYLADHPYRVGPEVVNLTVRHASGCELLCAAAESRTRENLRLLVPELRRHYDAVLLDGGLGGRHLVDVAVDLGDALLLVGLPTADSVESAGLWIERVWSLGLERRTALLLNRVPAWPEPPPELRLAFLHHAPLPEEPLLPALDQEGLPWSLDGRLRIARRLSDVAAQLFPALMPGDRDAA